jgi:hypothetical protein
MDDASEITVLQVPRFKAEATNLIGAQGIEAVAVYPIDHPDAGDAIRGAGGLRKLRWAASRKGSGAERGSFTCT